MSTKKRDLLGKYVGCSIVVSAKVGAVSPCGRKYCITDVQYCGHTIADHMRLSGLTYKGKGDKVFLEITVGEYKRADGTTDYGAARYKYIPISRTMGRYENQKKRRRQRKKVW